MATIANKNKYFKPSPVLNESSAVPLHHQLAEAILNEIIKSRVASGTPLIPERALAAEEGLSRITVHKAYEKLLNEKVLEQEAGGRIYYISNDMTGNCNFSSFLSIGIMMPGKFSSHISADKLGTLDYFGGIMDEASEKALSATIISMPSEKESRENINRWEKNLISRLSGIIYLGCDENNYATELILSEKSIPHIFISGTSELPHVSSVLPDLEPGLLSACLHLQENGHKRIGILSIPPAPKKRYFNYENAKRTETMLQLMKKNKLECREEWILKDCRKEENIAKELKWLLSAKERPTAFMCHNDAIAINALAALKSLNIKVPQDISLIGFDDSLQAANSEPPLTTVKKHRYIIGMKSVSLLMESLKSINNPMKLTEYVPTSLVIRGSTTRASAT